MWFCNSVNLLYRSILVHASIVEHLKDRRGGNQDRDLLLINWLRFCFSLYIVVSPRAFSSSVLPPLSITPSPHHSFLISHFSDPVMSKGVEGGGSSAASALKRQRRGFRGCRRMIRGGLGKGRLQWWRGFPARGDGVSPWRASVGSPWR